MNQVEVFTEVDAPPEAVWEVLLEFDSYPEWNPLARAIDGVSAGGDRLGTGIESLDVRRASLEPTIVAVEKNRRLARMERLVVPFAFDGYHEFHLEPLEDGRRTRLLHRETFRGALVPLLFDRPRTERAFEAMNDAIKARAERRASASSRS